MSDLIAITYDDEQAGRAAFEALGGMQKMQIIELDDAALAIKDEKGKVKVKQTLENKYAGMAATSGFFWGLLIGLIFGGPLFWGLFTALLSGAMAKTRDLGIDNSFIKDVGNSLDPGGSAVFMLVSKATPDKAVAEMEKYGGHLFQTSLSDEDEAALREALEHDHVKSGAEATLDLEASEV